MDFNVYVYRMHGDEREVRGSFTMYSLLNFLNNIVDNAYLSQLVGITNITFYNLGPLKETAVHHLSLDTWNFRRISYQRNGIVSLTYWFSDNWFANVARRARNNGGLALTSVGRLDHHVQGGERMAAANKENEAKAKVRHDQ